MTLVRFDISLQRILNRIKGSQFPLRLQDKILMRIKVINA